MAKFKFSLPTQDQIRNSVNGRIMLSIINNDYEEQFTLVTGCPGSGKTTVSILRLIRLSKNDKPVLLLTYQKMLKLAIESSLLEMEIPRGKVNTIHSWYPKISNGQLLGFSNQTNRLSASDIEETLKGKVNGIELILDEGQDLEERIFQSFPKVFDKIMIGADDDQQMHSSSGSNENTISKYVRHSLNEFELQFNYRNTYQVYEFARYFVPQSRKANDTETLKALEKHKNDGDLPEVISFDNQSDMKDRLQKILKEYKGFNIGILLSRKEQIDAYHEIISDFGYSSSKYHSGISRDDFNRLENNLQSILITTYISAKGLEFDIVLMPEFERMNDSEGSRKQAYVGCTRAKNRLVIMYVGNKPAILNSFPASVYDDGTDIFASPSSDGGNDIDDLPF
jgi:DNA helicase IV